MSVTEFLRGAEAFRRRVSKEEREALRTHELRETFSDTQNSLNTELRAHAVSVQQQLQQLRMSVSRFQQQLPGLRVSADGIQRLQETMADIESSISVFKDTQHQRFEELLKEEQRVQQEISVLERRMEDWSVCECVCVRAEGPGPRSGSSKLPWERGDAPVEVVQLERFLQQTGRCGGWDEREHLSFLRLWNKHGGAGGASFRAELQRHLPDRSPQELQQHQEWHQELQRLQEHRREAIRRWRAARQRQQTEEQQEEQTGEQTEEQTEERRQQEERRRRQQQDRLQAWKSMRAQQQEQQQQEQLRQQIQHSRRAAEQRRRQQELRVTVEAQVQQRKQQEEQRRRQQGQQEQEQQRQRSRHADGAIRLFQHRDSLRLEEKLQQKLSEQEEQRQRQRTLTQLKEKVELQVLRDPDRLCRPTKVWQERLKEIGPSGAAPLTLMQTFHRAVPAWRQES